MLFESFDKRKLAKALGYLEAVRVNSRKGLIVSAGVVRHQGRLKVLLEVNRWQDGLASNVVKSHKTQYQNGSSAESKEDPYFGAGWVERLD